MTLSRPRPADAAAAGPGVVAAAGPGTTIGTTIGERPPPPSTSHLDLPPAVCLVRVKISCGAVCGRCVRDVLWEGVFFLGVCPTRLSLSHTSHPPIAAPVGGRQAFYCCLHGRRPRWSTRRWRLAGNGGGNVLEPCAVCGAESTVTHDGVDYCDDHAPDDDP